MNKAPCRDFQFDKNSAFPKSWLEDTLVSLMANRKQISIFPLLALEFRVDRGINYPKKFCCVLIMLFLKRLELQQRENSTIVNE